MGVTSTFAFSSKDSNETPGMADSFPGWFVKFWKRPEIAKTDLDNSLAKAKPSQASTQTSGRLISMLVCIDRTSIKLSSRPRPPPKNIHTQYG